ncbi:MAG: radical SAM protein [Candidatus Helarchaeota archaeon]|nr:radical SAM protein [Candidatus Helarchaeota archaeon]
MRFRIALINPGPVSSSKEGSGKSDVEFWSTSPPLGILYLTAVLKKENFHVDVIDQEALRFNLEQIMKWIKKKDPDIVGFSTLTNKNSNLSAVTISREIKKWNPNVKIVFGNKHATTNDLRILKKYDFIDACVRGEGEYSFLELVNAVSKGQSLKNIKGITYSENGTIKRNENRGLIQDLDELPFPDRKSIKFEYKAIIGGLHLAPTGFTSMLSSRGCPFQCAFCHNKRKYGYRRRSNENIIEEMEYLESEGYKFFVYADDNFTMNKKKVIKLCDMMKKNKIDLDWIGEGRVDQISLDLLKAMRRANCRILFYGIESANQRILDYYNKRITPAQSILAVNKARKAKIPYIIGSFVVGGPSETLQEIQNTLDFSLKLDIDFPFVNLLGTMPGTDIWDNLVEKNLIDENKHWETGVAVPDIDPVGVPTSIISDLMIKSLRKFFLRPKFIIKEVYRIFTSFYQFRLMIKVLSHNIKNFKNFSGVRSFTYGRPEQSLQMASDIS